MKKLMIVLFVNLSLYAGMGDCLTCHPKLLPTIKEDKRHTAMQTCIECHSANKTGVLECGEKCFSCHSEEDLDAEEIKEHSVIQECRECHVDVVHDMFDTSNSFNQSKPETLKDFLIK